MSMWATVCMWARRWLWHRLWRRRLAGPRRRRIGVTDLTEIAILAKWILATCKMDPCILGLTCSRASHIRGRCRRRVAGGCGRREALGRVTITTSASTARSMLLFCAQGESREAARRFKFTLCDHQIVSFECRTSTNIFGVKLELPHLTSLAIKIGHLSALCRFLNASGDSIGFAMCVCVCDT